MTTPLLQKSRLLPVFALIALFAAPFAPMPAAASAQSTIANRYIVVLKSSTTDSLATAATLGKRVDDRFTVENSFQYALKGFSASFSAETAAELESQPEVLSVEIDQPVSMVAQTLPTGIRRIGADHNSTAKIGTGTNPVNINVAVIDTGSGPHGELNVVGGTDCTGTGSFNDNNGHGSHVAGTIGALDNTAGVVGVAPGARIWSVKVLDAAGNGFDSWVICGIDWVTANAASKSIRVANMSLGGSGVAGANCASGAFRQAICNSVNTAGVAYTVAAGNSHVDVSGFVPAAYPEVIAVAALNDSDGLPGGTGPSNDRGCDDCWASFINYGAGIDIVAPGVDILSTWLANGYATIDGTSMASPHVAGAAALYIAVNGNVGPAAVRTGLQAMSDFVVVPNDPIAQSEYVLDVSDGWSNVPTPTPTNTSVAPTAIRTATPSPTATRGSIGRPTATRTSTPVPTNTSTNTPIPTNTPTNTPVPTNTPTNTPVPTNTPTNTAVPTLTPTNTQVPTAIPSDTPVPTLTQTPGPLVIVGSGQSTNSNSATNAYDLNAGTNWKAAGIKAPKTAYAWFDLGASQTIGTIQWLLSTGAPAGFADGLKIQLSNDGQNWTTIATPGAGSPGNWQSLPAGVTARYVQFFFDNTSNSSQIGFLAEVTFLP